MSKKDDGLEGTDELFGADLGDVQEASRKLIERRLKAGAKLRDAASDDLPGMKTFIIGFEKTVIPAHGRITVSNYTSLPFVSERLIVAAAPDPYGWRWKCSLLAVAINVFCAVPIIFAWLRDGVWSWRPLYERAPDPRNIVDIQIGGVSQFGEPQSIPASVFHFDAPHIALGLTFDVATSDKPFKVVVENTSNRELDFACAISGHVVEQPVMCEHHACRRAFAEELSSRGLVREAINVLVYAQKVVCLQRRT